MTTDPREILLKRLAALTGREEAIAKHLRGGDGRLDADFADIANFTAADEVLEGLEDAALTEIESIRNALVRVANGTYGRCITCTETVSDRRLAALPATPFCQRCAT